MKVKLNKLAAGTAAALGVALSGIAIDANADAMGTKPNANANTSHGATSLTRQSDQATMNQSSTSQEARLSSIAGQNVKDASGAVLGKIESYSAANGQVTATVSTPTGETKQVPLGAVDTLAAQIPSSGTFELTVAQNTAAGASGSANGASAGMNGSSSTEAGTSVHGSAKDKKDKKKTTASPPARS